MLAEGAEFFVGVAVGGGVVDDGGGVVDSDAAVGEGLFHFGHCFGRGEPRVGNILEFGNPVTDELAVGVVVASLFGG